MALTKISAFGSQSLSATAWSLAKLILRKEELLEAISAQCVLKVESFAPQNLANASWAFAKLQVKDDFFMSAIASRVATMKEAIPKELSSTL